MLEIATASLNTLPYPAVSPADSLVLNRLLAELQSLRFEVAQLREDNQELIKKAVQPLQDEVSDLKAMIALQGEKIAALEATQDHQAENELIQLRLIKGIRDEIHKDPEPTDRSKNHVDELHRLMIEEKTAQVSILKASRLLGISKERMRQLKPLILADGRFEMGWASLKGQKGLVIKIRQYIR